MKPQPDGCSAKKNPTERTDTARGDFLCATILRKYQLQTHISKNLISSSRLQDGAGDGEGPGPAAAGVADLGAHLITPLDEGEDGAVFREFELEAGDAAGVHAGAAVVVTGVRFLFLHAAETDVAALEALVRSQIEEQEVSAQIKKTGLLVRGREGVPMRNPLLSVRTALRQRIDHLLAEFGMTPSSRTRVKTEQPAIDTKVNPVDELLNS